MRLFGAKAWGLVLVLGSATAFAQQDSDVNTAYRFAAEGLKAFDAGSYAESLDRFTRAFSIVRLPSLALYMARTNARLGHLLAARDLYAEVARLPDGVGDPEVQAAARGAAAAEAASLQESIPRLAIQAPGVPSSAVAVLVDSTTVPSWLAASGWQVDPGPHRVTVNFGNQQQTQLAFLVEGELKTVVFRFPSNTGLTTPRPLEHETAASAARTRMTRAGWVSLGLGAAAFAVSGATTVLAVAKHAELDDKGPWDVDRCERAGSVEDCQAYGRLRTYSTVAFYTGAVGVATGAALLLLAPAETTRKPPAQSRLMPLLGVGYAGVQGQFD